MKWWRRRVGRSLKAPRAATAPLSGYPDTYRALAGDDPTLARPKVFDPAFCQFPNGFRPGEPSFQDADVAKRWFSARRRMMSHLLRQVSGSTLRDSLVLRGGALMHAWFGAAAREPHDLDWVVQPPELKMSEPAGAAVVTHLIRLAADAPTIDGITIDVAGIATDDIWRYERAPGRRIVFPWTMPGMPRGAVQMDIVYNEPACVPCGIVDIILPDDTRTPLRVASMEQALAWKIFWLVTDVHPQGKDWYDAVLLAESTPLDFELLDKTLGGRDGSGVNRLATDAPLRTPADWPNFLKEYPAVTGSESEWKERFVQAIAPTFAGRDQRFLRLRPDDLDEITL